ncbi:ROK family protein [Candidatus Sodalis endolongispinus]|uniref:ROK family protein n=1 Tax=Candidatus Sodalis endolongispinus TaxID=2812662 RepID=A0ABS5YCY4_9GAMM|nr:ROK family protein [Candidatus Sodalis endolongispinus]MBT9431966.1 ROK family protein [Candidatus Sodalis endolongispinus]
MLDIYSSLSLIWRYSYCLVFQGDKSLAQIPPSWRHSQPSSFDALEQRYGSDGLMQRARDVFSGVEGQPPSPQALFSLAAAGDERAQVLMNEYGVELGRIAAAVATILDPSILILGGGLSQNLPFAQRIIDEFTRRNQDTRIEVSQMGSEATVVGACLLARDVAITHIVDRYHRPICARPTLLPVGIEP